MLTSCILILLTILQSCIAIKGKDANEVFGVVMLDSITFPKIIPSTTHDTVVLFADKAKVGSGAYPTTDAVRDHFLTVAAGKQGNDLVYTVHKWIK
jgi:hypothetical protein